MKIGFPSAMFLSTINILLCTVSSLFCVHLWALIWLTDEELYNISKMKCEAAQWAYNYNVKQLRYEDIKNQNSGQTVSGV